MKKNQLILLLAGAACATAVTTHGQVTALIDFGSDATFRGVTSSSPDINGNHWNSTAFGFLGNLVDTTGAATTMDWAPDGLGGVDSFNSLVGATSNPPTAGELSSAQTLLNGGSIGDFGVAEAAIDFYVSNNGTSSVGRFQIQQVTEGQAYDLQFYGARQFTGTDTQTTYSVFDDNAYSNLLGSVTISHGDGGSNANITNVGVISGLVGPSNSNNIFYIQWEGVSDSTAGYINAMSITAVPEPGTFALMAGIGALGLIYVRRRLSR
jgi:hypothetical protein